MPHKQMVSHKDCDHPKTQAGREKCRRRQGRYSPSQAPEARRVPPKPPVELKSKPLPKAEPIPREPKPPTEAQLKARRRWTGEPLTPRLLSGMIYKKLRRNRDRQYVFTREWIGRQYPGTNPEMVDAALQHLVDTGRISSIPL